MSAPSVRRLRGLGAVLALGLAAGASACTGSGDAAPGGSSAASASSVQTLRPPQPVTVVDGATPGALSVAVSRALFAHAATVVVVQADDAAGIATARTQAERLGAPLLVQDAPATSATTAMTTTGPGTAPPASGQPRAADPALVAELARLAPRTVLRVGAPLTGLPGRVTDSAAGLPAARPRPAMLTVLVPAGTDPGAAAAAASARAAGAVVVPVRGSDPRGDAVAGAAIASAPRQVLAAGGDFGPVERLTRRLAVVDAGRQLPGGGQTIFPGRRLVALYGTPGTPSLGVLGEQGADASIARAQKVAQPYVALSDVPVVPTFEIIATVASGAPGPDGNFSNEQTVDALRPLVEKAGAAGMYVVLDLQPGRADFLSQAKLYTPLLELPYVGLALDAEWRLTAGQRPLQQIGSVGIDEVNGVVDWLADLTAAAALPQKLLVLHQFKLSMLRDEARLDTSRDEIAPLIHMDGQGAPGLKDQTWAGVTGAAPPGVTFGWKDFYDEDEPMLTPTQTMSKRPTPSMISYQ